MWLLSKLIVVAVVCSGLHSASYEPQDNVFCAPSEKFETAPETMSEAVDLCEEIDGCKAIQELIHKMEGRPPIITYQYCPAGFKQKITSPIRAKIATYHVYKVPVTAGRQQANVFCAPSEKFETGSPKTLNKAVDLCEEIDGCKAIQELIHKTEGGQSRITYQYCPAGFKQKITPPIRAKIATYHVYNMPVNYERQQADVYCAPSTKFDTGSPATLNEAVDLCKEIDDCEAIQELIHKGREGPSKITYQYCTVGFKQKITSPIRAKIATYHVYKVPANQ